MNNRLKQIKDKVYWFFAQKNEGINREFGPYVDETRSLHHELRHERWFLLAKLNLHYRVLRKTTPLLQKKSNNGMDVADVNYYKINEERKTRDEILEILDDYDIVSFDIFDTALYRKVEKPTDVFTIMALEMGHEDFENLRIRAERLARSEKERKYFTREVTLEEIYDVLFNEFGINRKWMKREIELEYDLSIPNPFILDIFKELLARNKTVIFVSDMYLDIDTITRLLNKGGYFGWKALYVSNEYGKTKGDGSLQRIVLGDFSDKRIIHIGDNLNSDVKMSRTVGIAALYNPAPVPKYREEGMDNLVGSFYRATINTTMNNGLWEKSIYYSHGFRVGGILTALFCNWINELVIKNNIDKVLFCARDCDVIYRVYNKFYKRCDNDYLQISRYAIMAVCPEKYLYDFVHRTVLRSCQESSETKTIEVILNESGFDYLVEKLDRVDIDKYAFPASIDLEKLEKFIYSCVDIILEHSESNIAAAQKYFKSLIGEAKSVLIVDVGWSGTCLSASKYFIEKHVSSSLSVYGALMCSSDNKPLKANMEMGFINSFIYSPFHNTDLKSYMFPQNENLLRYEDRDRLRMPLEYLFTSTEPSLLGYAFSRNGDILFLKNNNVPANPSEIKDMQEGILDFVHKFSDSYGKYLVKVQPSLYAHVAYTPLQQAIMHSAYCYHVYKNFAYDARVTLWDQTEEITKFGRLFSEEKWFESQSASVKKESGGKKKILFITPELSYTGAPRSLLRMCKVAINLGYEVEVWSTKQGPFGAEYRKYGIKVKIVPDVDAPLRKTAAEVKKFDMAVCNTIFTEQFVRICSRYIPTIWYIREATNVPNLTRNNPQRKYLLRHSRNLYCVSEYAADALKKYSNQPIKVIRNCVEDEADLAVGYTVGTSERIRFAQWGTIEFRKGFDVLLSAYESMPPEYQAKAELYFAGRFIKQATSYSAQLLNKVNRYPNVHFLGELTGIEKTTKLSEMDIVVVASRDESCSLVLLEGAMLSKPLITTENVGANYMVKEDNGFIVKTGDYLSLADAMMKMIDNRSGLKYMGERSRVYYEKYASMKSYTSDMKTLFSLCENKKSLYYKKEYLAARVITSEKIRHLIEKNEKKRKRNKDEHVIVSLTSHPGRVRFVEECIKSLLNQTCKPERILLWLSKEQFNNTEHNLPESLVALQKNKRFEVRWVEEDLAPHKKYFYAMQEFPEYPIITVDDDVIYENDMIEKLMDSYRKFPRCVSASRANLITFREDGSLRSYNSWIMEYSFLTDTPSKQLMPTGVGGVLYPPHCLPREAFNKEAIQETCLYADDLWLKVWTIFNGYLTVVPAEVGWHNVIEEAQTTALWRMNVNNDNNDTSMVKILTYFNTIHPDIDWVKLIREEQ